MISPYPWQTSQWMQFQQRKLKGQLPHALLLHGPEGIGKEDFAQLAGRALLCEQADTQGLACGHCKSCQLIDAENHPDFTLIQPEEAGKAIKIDQIRELIQLMTLSPHFSGYRIVIIAPADQMNLAAANSLLKTLEEPQDNTVIFLATSRLSRLPATIRSRCQMLRFARPETADAASWLNAELENNPQAGQLLMAANGAPLLARQMAVDESIAFRQTVLADLMAISAGQKQAMNVAAEWLKQANDKTLQWVYHWVGDMIRIKCVDEDFVINQDVASQLQSFAQAIDLNRLYQFLDQVNEAIRLRQTSANELLLLEGLLLNWTYLKNNRQQERA